MAKTQNGSFTTMANKLNASSSVLLGRARLANLVGTTFEGSRDLYKYLGYKRNLSFDDYDQRYRRGGIAGRVVDVYPQATWRNPPKILDKDSQEQDEQSKFVGQFNDLAQRLNLFHYMERVDKLAGIGQYAVLLIGVKGATKLDKPMPKLRSTDDILFVTPYSQHNAPIKSFVTDPGDARFGLPEVYNLKLGKDLSIGESTANNIEKEVHHSRLLHVADNLIEDDIFGLPRMHRIWNYLDDLDKIVGGSAEAVWRVTDRGMQFNVDPEAELDPDDEADFTDEIEEYMHNLKRYIKTKGVEVNNLGSDEVKIDGPFESTMQLISGTTGIPTRILMGSERGQLASQSDDKNFNARVKERQQSYGAPVILRPFTDKLIKNGAFGTDDIEYKVKWPDVSTLTEKERADVAARFAQGILSVSKQTPENVVMDPESYRKRFIED